MHSNNNLQEYQDPFLYDCEYGTFDLDIPFFKSFTKKNPGPILDLACGTGRLAISFAKEGLDICGLDICNPMLQRAKEKTKAKSLAIEWYLGDVKKFKLNKQFALIIMGGNSFQALLTPKEQNAMFSCVSNHLLPGGVFAFDTRKANLSSLVALSKHYEEWHNFLDMHGKKVEVCGRHTYNKKKQILTCYVERKWEERLSRSKIKLRYDLKEDLIKRLELHKLKTINIFAGYKNEPLTSHSSRMVFVCQKNFH